jgi:WD40 repeat protein
VWNVLTHRQVRTVASDEATAGALTSDARTIATTSGQRVTVWGSEGQRLGPFPSKGAVTGVALSPDGGRLAVAGVNGVVVTWNVSTGKRLSICHAGTKELLSVAFDSTGTRVVASSNDHAAHVCDIGLRPRERALLWHQGRVSAAAFSADGRWVATAGPITAGVGAPDSPKPLYLLPGHKKHALLTAVAWSPRGYRIVTGDTSGDIRTYDCRLCGRVSQLLPIAKERLAEISHR